MEDGEELQRLQELHDAVYEQARVWFQNLKIRFHNQILQHFGPMPEREADIQVNIQRSLSTSIRTNLPVPAQISLRNC